MTRAANSRQASGPNASVVPARSLVSRTRAVASASCGANDRNDAGGRLVREAAGSRGSRWPPPPTCRSRRAGLRIYHPSACCPDLKRQAWSLGTETKPRTVMTPSSWTANSTSSPSLTCNACLIGSGRVSCAFWRSLTRALVRGRSSFLASASFKVPPRPSATWTVQLSQPILARNGAAMRLCELSGQPRTADGSVQAQDRLAWWLSRATPTADVAGPVSEVLAEGVGEVRYGREATPGGDVGDGR